jgi:hypothetical protein
MKTEEQTMPSWQKEVNSQWLSSMKDVLKDNGVWVWGATGFKYKLHDGKFIGETTEASDALKQILPDNDINI